MIFAVIGLLFSCSTRVTRTDINSTIDLSGKWNDTDSRLVAEEMVKSMISESWYRNFISSKGRVPEVVVGKIRNRSYEHISKETFIKDIEREFTNSGAMEFVANKEQRKDIGNEMDDQSIPPNSEINADLMILGSIDSILDKEGDNRVRFYQITLELLDLNTRKKVWIGDKKIKKYIEKNKFGM